MIGKTLKRANPAPVLRYLLSMDKVLDENAHIIGGTMIGETPAELAREFRAIRRLRPGVKRYIYHQSLRAVDGEGERLSDDTWLAIAQDHAAAMGFGEGQWIAIRHEGHIHIVGSRVLFDGSLVSDSHDWRRAEASVRAIEKKYGLTEVEPSHLLEPTKGEDHVRTMSQAEIALAQKSEASVRGQLQTLIETVLDRPQTFTEFADALFDLGVLVRPNLQSTGRLAGLSFALQDRPELEFAGSSLGRKFTLKNLMSKGLSYDETRDRAGVGRCLERCEAARSQGQDGGVSDREDLGGAGLGKRDRAAGGGDCSADGGSRDDSPAASGDDQGARGLDRRTSRADGEDNGGVERDGAHPGADEPSPGGRESIGAEAVDLGDLDQPPGAGDHSSLHRLLDLVGRPGDAEREYRVAGAGQAGAGALPANDTGAAGSVPGTPEQSNRPLIDPAAAERHLQVIGTRVELAVRYPDGSRIRVLGIIDHRLLRHWAPRLRRRSALGQEVLIRPVKHSPVLLIPRQTVQQTEDLKREGVVPFLTAGTEWNRQDVWVRVAGDDHGASVRKLRTALAEGGLYPATLGDAPWGHLAGYRPDPRATKTTRAQLLSNRLIEIVDTVVVVSRELLERLRSRLTRRREVVRQTSREPERRSAEEKGRSR